MAKKKQETATLENEMTGAPVVEVKEIMEQTGEPEPVTEVTEVVSATAVTPEAEQTASPLEEVLPDLGIEDDDAQFPSTLVGTEIEMAQDGVAAAATDDKLISPLHADDAVPSAANATAGRPRLLKDLNLRELDRYLTPEEKAEWNAIYASYRSRSILTGAVMGVDRNVFKVQDRASGETLLKSVYSAVIINYRVKVLIPESEMWDENAKWAGHVLRSMVGAKIEYIIIDIDRENGIAIASRRLALPARRKYFDTAPQGHKIGDRLDCQVLAVGSVRCVVSCNGYDCSLDQAGMTYSSAYDLRELYRAGQEMTCILKEYGDGNFKISVKDATSNPFDGVEYRHPIGARREAVITGKYHGGVFVTLSDGLSILCNYSRLLCDEDFQVGDKIIVAIERYNFERKLVSGRIMGKLW